MKRHKISFLFISVFFLTNLYSQSTDSVFIKDNSRAILFGIDKDLYVESFLGTAFSGKWHFSKTSAIRAGISVSSTYRNSNSDSESHISFSEQHSKETSKNYSVSTAIEYLKYFPSHGRVFFFCGLGPQITYRWTKSTEYGKEFDYLDWQKNRVVKSTEWDLGIHGTIGIECFVSNNVSLMAEYGLSVNYEDYKSNYEYDTSTSKNENQYFNIISNSKKLGISFYF